ncbi:uncharacterized protein LOC144876345 [Branchiostoma floridae x Branchiostoma japonicum]
MAIESGTFSRLSSLSYLNLRNNVITTVASGAFSGLVNLGTLYLDDNVITNISNDAFIGLSRLVNLYLSNNDIANIESGTFRSLSSLQGLYLQNNSIRIITSGAFSGLDNLRTLNLENNIINYISNDIFVGLSRLRVLYLRNNVITNIESGTFTSLSILEYLNLQNNDVNTIVSGALSGLDNLQTLNLDDNIIRNINNNTFSGLSRLRNLYLRNNGIATIVNNAFNQLSRVYELFLNNNSITNINSHTFAGLTHIRRLHLDNNPIANISSGSFSSLSNLQNLYLQNSGMTRIDSDTLIGLYNLRKMYLKNNKIRFIDAKTFSNLLNLQELYLDGNPLENLTDDPLVHLPKLRVISLVRCKLSIIPTLPPSIKSIHLGGNPIQTLQSGAFSDFRNLVDPDLCNQYVNAQADYQQIDETDHYDGDDYGIYYYYYHYYYDYDYNYDDNCDYIRAYSNTSKYPLSTLAKGAYDNLDQLHALTLRGNGIIYVSPGAFINLQSLRDLDLSYNEITYLLPDTFVNVPRLRFLYLHGNKLTALPPELFGTLPRLGKVTLHNNPWSCDCWLQGLVQWMNTTGVTYESQFPVKCTSSPVPSLLNVSLARVDPQSLICEQTTTPQITASSEDAIPSPTRRTDVTVTPRLVPPRAIALVTTTATESIVQWDSPSGDVMGFIISYVKTNGGRMQWTQPIHASVKVYGLQNLSPGTTYHVCVIAQYPVGRSAVTNDTCVTATTKGAQKESAGADQTLVIALAAVGVIAAVFLVGTIVMCKLRRIQSTPSSTPQTAQNIQMQSAVPQCTNTHAASPDNGMDTAAGGPKPTTPDDNFYMHLVYPDTHGGRVTNSSSARGRQSEVVYEDVDETRQRRGESVEDHVYQNDRM